MLIDTIDEKCKNIINEVANLSNKSIKNECELYCFERSLNLLDTTWGLYDKLVEIFIKHKNIEQYIHILLPKKLTLMQKNFELASMYMKGFFEELYKHPEQLEYLEQKFKQEYRHPAIEKIYDNKKYYGESYYII